MNRGSFLRNMMGAAAAVMVAPAIKPFAIGEVTASTAGLSAYAFRRNDLVMAPSGKLYVVTRVMLGKATATSINGTNPIHVDDIASKGFKPLQTATA